MNKKKEPMSEADKFMSQIIMVLVFIICSAIALIIYNDHKAADALENRTPEQKRADAEWMAGKPIFLHETDGVRVYVFRDKNNGRSVYFSSRGSMTYSYRSGKKTISVDVPGEEK